jgi:YD repeat-containing protein
MKTLSLLIAGALVAVTSLAQTTNTFPANGKVGIGTTLPAEKLHIYRDSAGYFNPLLVLEDDIAAGYTQLAFKGTGRTYHLGVGGASESGFSVANKWFLYDNNAGAMRLTVDASGNLGLGTTTPGNRLSIYSSTANTSGLQFARLNNSATAGSSNGKVLGLDASGNVILVNDDAGTTTGWSYTGNSGLNSSTNFIGTIDSKDLVFRTNNIERSKFLANGNYVVGTGTDKGKTFQVFGTGYFGNTVSIGTDSTGDANYNLYVSKGIRARKVRVDADSWADYVFEKNYVLPKLNELEEYIQQHKHLPDVQSADEAQKQGVDLGENQAVLLKKIEELTLYVIQQNKELEVLKSQLKEQQQIIDRLNK